MLEKNRIELKVMDFMWRNVKAHGSGLVHAGNIFCQSPLLRKNRQKVGAQLLVSDVVLCKEQAGVSGRAMLVAFVDFYE